MSSDQKKGDTALYLRLVRDARPYWGQILLIFILGLLAAPLALLLPVPLAIVVDDVLGEQSFTGPLSGVAPETSEGLLVFAAVLLVTIVALSRLRDLGSTLLEVWTSSRLTLEFRARLFQHMQRLSFRYHDSSGTSDSVYRIQYDAVSISTVAVNGISPFITAAVTLGAMIYVVASIDPVLAVIALAVAPILVALTWFSRRHLRGQWRQLKILESSSMSVIQEALGNLRVVKGFGQEDREHQRFVDASSTALSTNLKVNALNGSLSFLASMATAIGTALVLVVGAVHVQEGVLTLGQLTLVMGYMSQLYSPLRTLSESVMKLQSALSSAERAYEVLDEERDVEVRPDARALGRAKGHVSFEGVTFAYRPGDNVLQGVTFDVPAGTKVGIQGLTGSGKTTLISLLMRFYDPADGRITLDGVDIREFRIEELRSQFAIVLQDPVLFRRSIAENIAYARPSATMEEIEEAARLANAHEFISRMPDGYESIVGDRGLSLSGGERQRISLARAFLKDAPILILDEPTSSVDLRTEESIVQAMERLIGGRTTFVIAHRLSTLESCDMRLEVHSGQVRPAHDSAGMGGVAAEAERLDAHQDAVPVGLT